MTRLKQGVESDVARQIRTVGSRFAEKVAQIAVGWSNWLAVSWVIDSASAGFLVVCHSDLASSSRS